MTEPDSATYKRPSFPSSMKNDRNWADSGRPMLGHCNHLGLGH